MNTDEALKRALELAQEGVEIHSPNAPEYKVCAALIALAQPKEKYQYGTPLLDAMTKDYVPPQRTWVGLTDEEVNTIYEQAEVLVNDSWVGNGTVGLMFPITLYKMFEAKLKEKNNV